MATEESESGKPDWVKAAENSVCFDAEPFLAYYWDAEGSDRVEDYFVDILQGERAGYVSDVTYCEVRYHILRENKSGFFHFYEFLRDTIALDTVSSEMTWRGASDVKSEYAIALGDAFSIATAVSTDSTLIVGADDDFEGIEDVNIARIRTVPD